MMRVHTIDADRPFLPALVDGLLAWDRELLADTLVLLPSRRACLAAREAFRRAAGGQPLLLPRLVPIGEPDEGELALDGAIELSLPPAIGPIRRRLLLTRLIRARDPTMAHEQAVRLAAELARFLDELHNEEVALDRLEGLAPETLAEHWQESLVFLRLLRDGWPAILAEEGRLDVAHRRRLLLDALAAKWRRAAPRHAGGCGRRHRHHPGGRPAAGRHRRPAERSGRPARARPGARRDGLGTGRPEPSAVRAQAAPGG